MSAPRGRGPDSHRPHRSHRAGRVDRVDRAGRGGRARESRDRRLLFGEGWLLALGLLTFGGAGLLLFYEVFPSGWRGVGRFAVLVVVVLLAGGLVAPIVTRGLLRRR